MYVRKRYVGIPSQDSLQSNMDIYIFDSDPYKCVKPFTIDRTGANLPALFAPWTGTTPGPYVPIWSLADPPRCETEASGQSPR